MSTTTSTPPRKAASSHAPAHRGGMPGLGRLISTEFRVFNRDYGNLFFVVAFPTVLLLGMGLAIPGMDQRLEDAGPWTGLQVIDLMVPTMVCVAIATAGLSSFPTYLATYREKGVLRRLSTTPMAPQGILVALASVNLFWLAIGSVAAVAIAVVFLDVPLPVDWGLLLLTLPLAIGSVFGIGLILGGVMRKAAAASGIGMLIYFPLLFFAGLWTPGPIMPEMLRTIATWMPLGGASQAMTTAWFGVGDFPTEQFISMALWTVLTFAVAVKVFRWK
ncbi:ABC transporter permease [Ornithinimicrobium pratense]|uniref:Transport permease protein n=1 Tax=Ornithinimicrobium pratense TaxID=2593973 RepID=A0A5J6V4G8_9MICO|nr:ABC transporter permease [Ornithinimicrobium pratense]QFG68194.1 ABC transporter permease [Ornithinimicrobium pratense]